MLPLILDPKSVRRRLVIALSAILSITLQTIKQSEQDEEDNGDLGANVKDEVRTKQHHKREKKRVQQAARNREEDHGQATHEGKLVEVLEDGPASQWKLKVLYSSRRLEIQSLQLWFQAVATRKLSILRQKRAHEARPEKTK